MSGSCDSFLIYIFLKLCFYPNLQKIMPTNNKTTVTVLILIDELSLHNYFKVVWGT